MPPEIPDAMSNEVPPGVVTFMGKITDAFINPILGVIFALALVYFLTGLMKLIFNAGDTGQAADGKRHMVWGVVGMTIMVSVFGLLSLVRSFGVTDDQMPDQLPLNDVSVME